MPCAISCKRSVARKSARFLAGYLQGAKLWCWLGKSGGGKSVFLRHLIGLMQPISGSIEFEGRDVAKLTTNVSWSRCGARSACCFRTARCSTRWMFTTTWPSLARTEKANEKVIRDKVCVTFNGTW